MMRYEIARDEVLEETKVTFLCDVIVSNPAPKSTKVPTNFKLLSSARHQRCKFPVFMPGSGMHGQIETRSGAERNACHSKDYSDTGKRILGFA